SPAQAWRITPELAKERTQMEQRAKANPTDTQVQFELAITYGYTNNLIDGMNQLKKVNELDPTFKEKALPLYINKVNESPNDWRLRFRLAFAYYFNDRREEAIREFNNVLILDPYNVWAYGYIALLYGDLGEVDKAMATVRKGLAIDNRVAALHLLLGEGYIKKGDNWKGWFERMEAVRLKALGY
ncbi:MAG: hypothetical protein ABIE84_00890, partial [bacterium]